MYTRTRAHTHTKERDRACTIVVASHISPDSFVSPTHTQPPQKKKKTVGGSLSVTYAK